MNNIGNGLQEISKNKNNTQPGTGQNTPQKGGRAPPLLGLDIGGYEESGYINEMDYYRKNKSKKLIDKKLQITN